MRYEEILEYVEKLVGTGDGLLGWVDKKSDELRGAGVYRVDSSTGRLLEIIARMGQPKRILEIGSGAGYSTVWLMKGAITERILDAIDANPTVIHALEQTVKKAGLQEQIRIHAGRALDVLPAMKGTYDLVFIDAEKDEYPKYLDEALRLTRAGSVILADNMFMSLSAKRGEMSPGVSGIAEYTRRIFNDPRLSSLIVPLGDGLAISFRVK